MNTYLIYLKFQKMRGLLGAAAYEQACQELRDELSVSPAAHLKDFLDAWVET